MQAFADQRDMQVYASIEERDVPKDNGLAGPEEIWFLLFFDHDRVLFNFRCRSDSAHAGQKL
jgi:hypothetical protein